MFWWLSLRPYTFSTMNESLGFIVLCSSNLTRPAIALPLRLVGGMSFFLLGVLALLANGALLGLLCKYRNLRSPAGWIMFNMALSDILTALTVVVFVVPVVSINCFPFDKVLLKVYTLLALTCYVKSVVSIMFVSTDRYFAVCRPLHYIYLVTKPKVIAADMVSWCLSGLYAASFLMSEIGLNSDDDDLNYKSVAFYIYIVVPWMFPLFTVILYCLMVRHVRRRRKVSCAPGSFSDLPQYHPQVKLAITMAIVTGIFLISNLPVVCVGVRAAARVGDNTDSVYIARGVAGFLFYTSCLLNPVVYVSTFRPIREAGKKFLCRSQSTETLGSPDTRSQRRNIFYMAQSPKQIAPEVSSVSDKL